MYQQQPSMVVYRSPLKEKETRNLGKVLFEDKNKTKDRVVISIDQEVASFKSFLAELRQGIKAWVERRIEAQLEAEVEAWLHRRPYARRARVGHHAMRSCCCRCGTRQVQRFSRNGHRPRQIVTTFGVLTIWLPRVVCECGGSVPLPSSILRPYQRLWDDVLEQLGRWATLGLSLRQMQTEIGEQLHTQVGLRKLNEAVQVVRQPVELPLSSVPPCKVELLHLVQTARCPTSECACQD